MYFHSRCLCFSEVRGFKTEKDLEDFVSFANGTINNTMVYIAGVVFTNSFLNNDTTLPDNIAYKLRFSYSPRNAGKQKSYLNPYKGDTSWKTDFMFPMFQKVGPREKDSKCGGDPGWYSLLFSLQLLFFCKLEKQRPTIVF